MNCKMGDDKPVKARGYCSAHYDRWRKFGDPNIVLRIVGDDRARIDSYTDKSGDCWLWIRTILIII